MNRFKLIDLCMKLIDIRTYYHTKWQVCPQHFLIFIFFFNLEIIGKTRLHPGSLCSILMFFCITIKKNCREFNLKKNHIMSSSSRVGGLSQPLWGTIPDSPGQVIT